MGDSEDEYDRKRRDKFRGERAEGVSRGGGGGGERPPRAHEEWLKRDTWSRPRSHEFRGGIRDSSYSATANLEPISKRFKPDYYGDSHYNSYQPHYQHLPSREPTLILPSQTQQPAMMSFKSFLTSHDDNISETEATKKYKEYKLEFYRQQLNEFFVAHKEEEWFRIKYHPEESLKRKIQQENALKKRVEVFMELLNNNKIGSVSIDQVETTKLLKLLDTVMIKLEDGTEEDIDALDEEYKDMEVDIDKHDKIDKLEEKKSPIVIENDKVEEKCNTKDDGAEVLDPKSPKEEGEEEEDDDVNESKEPKKEEELEDKDEKEVEAEDKDADDVEPKPRKSEKNNDGSENEGENQQRSKEIVEKNENLDDKNIQIVEDDVAPSKSRNLHKTTSIFLRNLAPSITRAEIESICSRYDGFLRVALADPQRERRWMRKGWVTFKRDAKIKDICWSFNNIRLRDCELGAIVSKDLSKRIRIINGITAHKQVVRSDIRLSARVTLNLDNQAGLWLDEGGKSKPKPTFGLVSNNPVLHNITDYLIEEASAEEEELLGLEPTSDTQNMTSVVDREEDLISVLDKIILYLRIVHSVDYYNHCKYPNEDEMPNKCGILHARGSPPTVPTDMSQYIGEPIEIKMMQFLPEKLSPEDSESENKFLSLALKDEDTEVDKFVVVNTKELAKDKWLCPLSGKKFKGPDFIRKHIFNKHPEKVEEVKKEVKFFNNYVRDPKRPAEVMHSKREESTYVHPGLSGPPRNYAPFGGNYRGHSRFYNHGYGGRSRPYGGSHRGGGGADFRPVNHYRDLDAPEETF